MKRINILFIFMFFVLLSQAQQLPMFSQYMFDKALINPAYAGSSNWIVGTVKYRDQFTGFDGSPKTETFTFHAPIQKKHIGVGLKVIHDQIAVTTENRITGQFSYHLGLFGGKLSFGLEGGIIQQAVDFGSLIKKDQNDKALPAGNESTIIPDATFGVFYQTKTFYMGFSSMQLIPGKISYTSYSAGDAFAKLSRHYYLYVGNTFSLGESFALDPSILMKYVGGSNAQVDINANLTFKDMVTVGASYRTEDAMAFLVRYNITESLKIAYSYDMRLSKIATYSNAAHEIMISYGIKLLPPPAEKEVSPRYYF